MNAIAAIVLSIPLLAQQGHRVPVVPVPAVPQVTGGVEEITTNSGVRTWKASWLHDPDGTGPMEPIVIEVAYEPKPGETATQAASKFASDLQAAQAQFPPNVRQSP